MGDFLSFRRMITPVLIQIVFWIGVAVFVALGLYYLVAGPGLYGASGPVFGLLVLIFGPLLTRVYCELLIIIFRINETITEIKGLLEQRPPPPPPPPSP